MKEKGGYITHPKYKMLDVYKYKISTYNLYSKKGTLTA